MVPAGKLERREFGRVDRENHRRGGGPLAKKKGADLRRVEAGAAAQEIKVLARPDLVGHGVEATELDAARGTETSPESKTPLDGPGLLKDFSERVLSWCRRRRHPIA